MKGKPELPRHKPAAPETRTPYELGRHGAVRRQAAYERYNAFPPDDCPFKKGTPEETEYDRGWKDQMAEYSRRGE